jgi:hypothetical protein
LGRGFRRTLVLSIAGLAIGGSSFAGDPKAGGDLVPLDLKLPQPAFKGTPKDQQFGPIVEPLSDKPRPAMMVPAGLKNVAEGKKVASSDKNTPADVLAKITDGDKEATDQSIIFLRKGTQWVQIDLEKTDRDFRHCHLARAQFGEGLSRCHCAGRGRSGFHRKRADAFQQRSGQ